MRGSYNIRPIPRLLPPIYRQVVRYTRYVSIYVITIPKGRRRLYEHKVMRFLLRLPFRYFNTLFDLIVVFGMRNTNWLDNLGNGFCCDGFAITHMNDGLNRNYKPLVFRYMLT